jgi:phosphate:Na+ symporter
MSLTLVGGLLGGAGLVLLGITLLTDGLKLAAGPLLQRVLDRATRTRWRGLLAGASVTALVQSSSAVTLATIGFVNAGLLGLGQALWVLFGANVGTTMTGWVVALVGLEFDIDALALPLLGVGMALRLTAPVGRRGALGLAMAGFGLLFVGIDVLRETFQAQAAAFALPEHSSVLLLLLAGAVVTVLMQSSSASLALVLTATQGGLLPVQVAAAAVIGANIGTTVTAILGAIGATANARRAAAAHVAFNVLAGAVALVLLPWMLTAIGAARDLFGLPAAPAVDLALFHTSFNLLGVALMLPLGPRLVVFLQRRFRTVEEDESRPRYLDRTVLAVPALALSAIERELQRQGAYAVQAVRAALAQPAPDRGALALARVVTSRLLRAIGDFINQLSRSGLSADTAGQMPRLLRVARYHDEAAAAASLAATTAGQSGARPALASLDALLLAAEGVLAAAGPGEGLAPAMQIDRAADAFERAYQTAKADLLDAGARADLTVSAMDGWLRTISALRRAIEQLVKAGRLLGAPPTASSAQTPRV